MLRNILKIAYYSIVIFIWVGLLFHKSHNPRIAIYSYQYALLLIFTFICFLYLLPRLVFLNKIKFVNYLLLISSIVLVILLAEGISHLILVRQKKQSGNNSITIDKNLYDIELDSNFAYVLKRNNKHHVKKTFLNGTVIYDVIYTIDGFRRRSVGQEYLPKNKHLILFGCSYMYGEGLNDNETLQYMLGKIMPQYNVYNYAVHGYGPQDMLALLETRRLPLEVRSNKGAAIYYFGKWDFDRAVGSMRSWWLYNSPYYRLNKGGSLERRGSFARGRPIVISVYRFLDKLKQKSKFCKLIDITLPLSISERDVVLTLEIIKESKKQYENQFDGKFYVLMNPFEDRGDSYIKEFTRLLEENGIQIIYYPLKIGWEYVIYGDGHPNAKQNEFLVNNLIRDLNN